MIIQFSETFLVIALVTVLSVFSLLIYLGDENATKHVL